MRRKVKAKARLRVGLSTLLRSTVTTMTNMATTVRAITPE